MYFKLSTLEFFPNVVDFDFGTLVKVYDVVFQTER